MKSTILVITEIAHIPKVMSILNSSVKLDVSYLPHPTPSDLSYDESVVALFTNPNKSLVYIDESIFRLFPNLKVIATASTGTVHIDKAACSSKSIDIISLTDERPTINRISSTAEHSLALTLAALRHICPASNAVLNGEWDYLPYVGRQLSSLDVGVVGYGRLGSLYSHYMSSLCRNLYVYDPYKDIALPYITQVSSLSQLFSLSDIVSLHVHVTPETEKFISNDVLAHAKSDILLVNTSRGEIINEDHLLTFLTNNPLASYATDVLSSEYTSSKHPFKDHSKKNPHQILITPHIGGMTSHAQEIAYSHAANLLINHLSTINP